MSAPEPALPPGYRLFRFDTVGSTNDEAKALARAGAAEGAVVWARQQTAGRGRRGRAWTSPPGNLYLSLVMRPAGRPAAAAQLGFVAALGLGEALAALTGGGLPIRYKWPNDLLVDGRKIAGILLESEIAASGTVEFVVVGVGVNLVSKPDGVEYPATSLAEAGNAGIAPSLLLQAFVRHFDDWVRRWRAQGFGPVRSAWLARASGLGEPIRVRLDRATLAGRFLDLDPEGALLLDAAGGCRRIAAGEVFPAIG